MKTRLLLIYSTALLINISLMSNIIYAQINWEDLNDNGGAFGVLKEYNYLMLAGIVTKGPVPEWDDMITYDPKCIQVEFAPENLWTCDNRRYSYTNSESYRYWLKIEIIGFDCDKCITINGHPEFGKICFDEPYTVRAYIYNNCDADIFGHTYRSIDEKITFGASISFNKNPEFGPAGSVPTGLNGKISTRFGSRNVLLYFDSYTLDNQAYYVCRDVIKARDLMPGVDTHSGELTFSTSYFRAASTSSNFDEFTTFFDVDSMSFLNTIEINDGSSGYQRICVPYGSQISLGNKMVTSCGWPYNCPVDGILSTYNGDEHLCDQNLVMTRSPFIANPSSTTLDLPEDGHPGHEFSYYFKHKLSIEGGPARELPDPTHVGIYNGFAAGQITSEDLPADVILSPNTSYNLRANPNPNLSVSNRFQYEWDYTFTPDNPGPLLDDDVIIFSPNYSNYKDGSMSVGEVTGEGEICYRVRDVQSGEIVESKHMEIKVEPTLVIEKPTPNQIFFIDATPTMPTIAFKAKLLGVPENIQEHLPFVWSIKLSYANIPPVAPITLMGVQTGLSDWSLDWKNSLGIQQFGGGDLYAEVRVTYNGKTYTANNSKRINYIRGQNIGGGYDDRKAAVENFINSVGSYSDIVKSAAKGAACYESPGYLQFEGGLPLGEDDGRGRGRGIMQLTDRSYITMASLWNWKENVLEGIGCCQERYRQASADLSQHEHTPSDLEIIKQILARYNGVGSFTYWTWNEKNLDFERNSAYCGDCGACGRAGEHKKNDQNECINSCTCSHTQSCYADGAYECSH
jgi:hypothetical protein